MTTNLDHASTEFERLACPLRKTNLYPTFVLAMRDMRTAHGRDEVTGEGVGNSSRIALSLGMVVLDTLSGTSKGVERRWTKLLTGHGVNAEDARVIYRLRCSLLHGYGPPRIKRRRVVLTDELDVPALDTSRNGFVLISVPVFCGVLVERIASQSPATWDVSEVEVTDLDRVFNA